VLKPFPTFEPILVPVAPEPPVEEVSPAAVALEQEAFALLQQRCSKCHTLGRVYGRLDTLERSLQTLERMRLKTGSGITDHEMEVLETYLRSQF
jgi:mono/diheme cytochrome c family protein